MIIILILQFIDIAYASNNTECANQQRCLQSQNTVITVNPLNYDNLTFPPIVNVNDPDAIKGAGQNITIFQIPPLSITQFQFDLRHLYQYKEQNETQFKYQLQWEIGIITNDELSQDDYTIKQSDFVQLPMKFLSNQTDKQNSFSFSLFALKELKLSIRMVIYSEEFHSNQYEFMNITKISNQRPNRAILGENKIFVFIIQEEDQVSLPLNPLQLTSDLKYPKYIVSFTDENEKLKPHELIQGINLFTPNSQYWTEKNTVLLPYIPYFSNCKGYGQYLFFSQIVESQACNLVPEDKTQPIEQLQFGQEPVGDKCDSILFECVLDEPINQKQQEKRWFELGSDSVLFKMLEDPMTSEEIISLDQIPSNKQVDVVIKNAIPEGKMARDVTLTISYYQRSTKIKRIIQGEISFSNFYVLKETQLSGQDPIYYNLIFNYEPMNQGQLVIAFALEWPVYFILYLGVGLLSIVELIFFSLYHYIFNRKRPRPSFKFLAYIKAIFPAAINGTILASIPVAFILLLITFVMAGKLFTIDLTYACQLAPATDADDECGQVLFDIFKNDKKFSELGFQGLRYSRTGLTFIVCGLYMVIVFTRFFVSPEVVEDKEGTQEQEVAAYNGNIWFWRIWRRSQILYVILLVTFFMMLLIQFSFTGVFEENVYLLLIILKLVQMIVEYALEQYFIDNLIISPISCTIASMIVIATMGASDFYDFLFSYFIELCIQMLERAYIIKIQMELTTYLEKQYLKLVQTLKKLLNEDNENEQQNVEEEKIEETEQKAEYYNNNDISDSDIIFSDQYQENLASDQESIASFQDRLLNSELDNSMMDNMQQDDYEQRLKQTFLEYQKKLMNIQAANNEESSQILSQHESAEQLVDYTDVINYFSNFANDLVTLIYNPVMVIVMWMFYDESYWAASYDIQQDNFIFYLIWSFILIPFQLVIDVLFLNLVEQYHDLDFLSYIYLLKQRFENRKQQWKGFDRDHACKVEPNFDKVDQWCYSSQFYFTTTLVLSGIFFIIFGTQIIYWNQYDIFGDQALIFIIIFWVMLCYLVQEMSIFIGRKLGIWNVNIQDNKIAPLPQGEEEDINQSTDIKIHNSANQLIQQQNQVQISNWDQALKLREREERLKEINNNLEQEQFNAEQFKRHFVNANKIWLRENLKLIFSPKTLKTKKKQILFQFQNIYGPIEKKKDDDPAEGFEDIEKEVQANVEPKMDFTQKKKTVISIPIQTQSILRYWLYRSRNMKKAIYYVGGLIEKMTKQHCEYCGLNWGLRAEAEQRIEDLFLQYLQKKEIYEVIKGVEIDEWQNYFSKNCHLRTTCFLCNVFMAENVVKDQHKNDEEQLDGHTSQIKKMTFKKIARIVLIWIKFYRFATNQDNDYSS